MLLRSRKLTTTPHAKSLYRCSLCHRRVHTTLQAVNTLGNTAKQRECKGHSATASVQAGAGLDEALERSQPGAALVPVGGRQRHLRAQRTIVSPKEYFVPSAQLHSLSPACNIYILKSRRGWRPVRPERPLSSWLPIALRPCVPLGLLFLSQLPQMFWYTRLLAAAKTSRKRASQEVGSFEPGSETRAGMHVPPHLDL